MESYICKECGKEAIVENNGKITRTCEHTCGLLLDMSVTVTGDGGANG